MKHSEIRVSRGLAGAMGLLFAGGVALAHEDAAEGQQRGNLPAASAAATTTGGSSHDRTGADDSTSRTPAVPDQPAAREREAAPPPDSAPPNDWHMGEPGTLIQLEELAPVEIIDLQKRLSALNLYHDTLDGIAGPHTRDALKAYFLKQAELAAQGQLDASALDLFDVVPVSPASGQVPGERP